MKPPKSIPIDYAETTEQKRLNQTRETGIPWKKWGPYLSERQWGTVREDYSHGVAESSAEDRLRASIRPGPCLRPTRGI